MHLKIEIPERWATEDEPLSIRCGKNEIQVFLDDKANSAPVPASEHLEDIAAGFGMEHLYGEVAESSFGTCTFGPYGTAVFRSEECPRIQVWLLSNGRILVWVIHVCRHAPDEQELSEAQGLVRSLGSN